MPGKKLGEAVRREAIIRAAFEVAGREQLSGLSMRAVAEAAGVSKGLVFFYFSDRETLLLALLDWLLETTLVVDEPERGPADGSPVDGLLWLVDREIDKLPADRARVELFLDYWVLGQRVPDIQQRIRAAFDRYREAFLGHAAAVVASSPERYRGVDAESLASAAVSFIEGCALQLIADPKRFDRGAYARTLHALVRPGSPRPGG